MSKKDRTSLDRRALIDAMGLDVRALEPRTRAAFEAFGEEVLFLREEVRRLCAELEEAASLADHDALCPVFNRRAFERELRREAALAERHGGVFCLLFIDLDSFKAVNDAYGHGVGDAALKAVSEALRANTRETDIIGRLGGDEFGVILPHASKPAAGRKADALCAAIAAASVERPDTEELSLSASIGVATWRPGVAPVALIAAADADMYARKPKKRAPGVAASETAAAPVTRAPGRD